MATIQDEKYTIGIVNNDGTPKTGVLVEFKIGASTYPLVELGNGKYSIASIPTGKYFVWIDSVNSGESVSVGSGQVSALGNQTDAFLIGEASDWKLGTVESVRVLLNIDQVSNQTLPDPTGNDGKILEVVNDLYELVPKDSSPGNYIEVDNFADLKMYLESGGELNIYNRTSFEFEGGVINLDATKRLYGANVVFATGAAIEINDSNLFFYNDSTQMTTVVFSGTGSLFFRSINNLSSSYAGTGQFLFEKASPGDPTGANVVKTFWENTVEFAGSDGDILLSDGAGNNKATSLINVDTVNSRISTDAYTSVNDFTIIQTEDDYMFVLQTSDKYITFPKDFFLNEEVFNVTSISSQDWHGRPIHLSGNPGQRHFLNGDFYCDLIVDVETSLLSLVSLVRFRKIILNANLVVEGVGVTFIYEKLVTNGFTLTTASHALPTLIQEYWDNTFVDSSGFDAFFLTDQDSVISGYKVVNGRTPVDVTPATIARSITSAAPLLFDDWISESTFGESGVSFIPASPYNFSFYGQVDDTSRPAYFEIIFGYYDDSTGLNVELGRGTTATTISLTPENMISEIVIPADSPVDPSDRLWIRTTGFTASSPAVLFTLSYGASSTPSRLVSFSRSGSSAGSKDLLAFELSNNRVNITGDQMLDIVGLTEVSQARPYMVIRDARLGAYKVQLDKVNFNTLGDFVTVSIHRIDGNNGNGLSIPISVGDLVPANEVASIQIDAPTANFLYSVYKFTGVLSIPIDGDGLYVGKVTATGGVSTLEGVFMFAYYEI